MRRRHWIGLLVFGLMFALVAVAGARAYTLKDVHAAQQFKHRQLHRDRGTVRFMLNHRWSRRHHRFMRIEKRAERRIVAELDSIRFLRLLEHDMLKPDVDVRPWLPTVACENGGRWEDSPGYFYLGLQFDPGTWRTAASHTGRWDTSKETQVINAAWTAEHATSDPWPNCPDPYFG